MALTPTSNNVVKKKVKRANETHTEKEMELNEKLVNVRRITKVVKGGRRFRFSALVVVGDGKGRIGFGNGKAKEIPDAVKKATHHAKTNMVHIPMREGRTLHHDVKGKFGAGKVIIRSANKGTGVIAGGAMRAIFEAMGIQDVVAKSIGSSNPDNLVRATIDALKFISSPRTVALFRDKKVGEIFAKLHNNQSVDDEEIKMDKNTVEINKEEE